MNKEFAPAWEEPVPVSQHASASQQSAKNNSATPQKQIVTIRLDVDMLEWFKAAGPGYQTRINQLLREHMEAERTRAAADQDQAAV
ncbi:MAG: BrnA antitoxin family protein [Telluria sp.]